MTIRYYSSLDDGAPLLPAVSSQRFIDNLRIVLINCLVTGYASKPGAGWTLAHDHPDGFTLSNGEGYINFVSVNSSNVAIYLLEDNLPLELAMEMAQAKVEQGLSREVCHA